MTKIYVNKKHHFNDAHLNQFMEGTDFESKV
jgi:hypothetical protein